MAHNEDINQFSIKLKLWGKTEVMGTHKNCWNSLEVPYKLFVVWLLLFSLIFADV